MVLQPRILAFFRFARREECRRADADASATPPNRQIDVRIVRDLFETVCMHVEDFRRGEEAGFLICSLSRLADRDILLVRDWMPIPEDAISRNAEGSVLSWSATFNSEVLERALDLDATAVLVHSHGSARPRFSPDDRTKEQPLFGALSRMLDPLPTGTLLLGRGAAAGSFWLGGRNDLVFRQLVILGDTIDIWPSVDLPRRPQMPRRRLVRQSGAIGHESDAKLAATRVAVLGVSGGGSHVIQQLSHQGIGALLPVDDQIVDETNLGRVVGAVEADVDITAKTALAKRVATAIDTSIDVVEIGGRFPSRETIAALKEADIVVACVDTFHGREAINAFCRRYLIPLVDVGITVRSSGEQLAVADGQVITSIPGRPCLRCWFVTDVDVVLARERLERPPGYDQNPDAPGDPQVVSMNGTLASEACNCVLDIVTGYSGGRRGAKIWQYDGRSGQLEQAELPSHRADCPACAEEGRGDPGHAA